MRAAQAVKREVAVSQCERCECADRSYLAKDPRATSVSDAPQPTPRGLTLCQPSSLLTTNLVPLGLAESENVSD